MARPARVHEVVGYARAEGHGRRATREKEPVDEQGYTIRRDGRTRRHHRGRGRREAAKEDQLRAKHRLSKYLLRYGQRAPDGCRAWTAVWWQWVRGLELIHPEQNTTLVELVLEVDHQAQRIERLDGAIDRAVNEAPEQLRALVDALQALRGVAKITAVTLATEFGSFSRFERAVQVMSYTGMVPSEHSSGPRSRRGAITKTGNSHLRRVLVEAAWHYRHRPKLNLRQKELQPSLAPKVAAVAWRAQERLHRRYWALANKSKPTGKIVTAVARELAGFVWTIGVETEKQLATVKAA